MDTPLYILLVSVLVATHSTPVQFLSLSHLSVNYDDFKPHIHHDDHAMVELQLFYYDIDDHTFKLQVPHGRIKHEYHQIEFDEMDQAHIPCYTTQVTFTVKINDKRVAESAPVSLSDLAVSYNGILPIELWNKHAHLNGWIYIRSNKDKCFDGKQKHYESHYTGIERITESMEEEYKRRHSPKAPNTDRPKPTEIQRQTDGPIPVTTFVETRTDFYSTNTMDLFSDTMYSDPMRVQSSMKKEIFVLQSQLKEANNPMQSETVQINQTLISIAQQTIGNNTQNVSLNICSDIAQIGDSLLKPYIDDRSGNTTIQCLGLQHFAVNITNISNLIPDSISLYLLNGSSSNETVLELIPDYITHTESNCDAIVVNLDWNSNNIHDSETHIPQCVYHSSPPWTDESDSDASINDECVPISHNEQTVQCACHNFGSYSTATQAKYSINIAQTIKNFDPYTIVIACVFVFLLCIFVESNCRAFFCEHKNDTPLVSLEVYLPNPLRHRMWVITREGRVHFLLRYKFEDGEHKNLKKLLHISKQLICNDGLIFPYFQRLRGSNHSALQRLINLFWLIISILLVTAIITAFNNDITPQYCTEGRVGYVGTDIFCMRRSEIPIGITFVFILCVWHYMHRIIFQRIHPNKLQMDLEALALMELKRSHKKYNSPSVSPKRVIKNRYSKSQIGDKVNENIQSNVHKIWTNILNTINPRYDSQSDTKYYNQFNKEDIISTQQYLKEIEKHRKSIFAAGTRFEAINYYDYDSIQNDTMWPLGDASGNDADIEEEYEIESDKLELRYVDLSETIENHIDLRRYSQECNRFNIAQLNVNNQPLTINENDEEDESDSSVATAIISGDSKPASVSSNSSLNSLSLRDRDTSERVERPMTARNIGSSDEENDSNDGLNQHQKTNTRLSVSMHSSDEDNEEKGMRTMRRDCSVSIEYDSPSQQIHPSSKSVIAISDRSMQSPMKRASKSSLDTSHILETVSDVSHLDMPSAANHSNIYEITASPHSAISMCHSNAPPPPSPVNEHMTLQNNITPTPSPIKSLQKNKSTESKVNDSAEPEILSVETTDTNEPSPSISELTRDDSITATMTNTNTITTENMNTETFTVDSDNEDTANQLLSPSPSHTIDNTENVNSNRMSEPITPPIDEESQQFSLKIDKVDSSNLPPMDSTISKFETKASMSIPSQTQTQFSKTFDEELSHFSDSQMVSATLNSITDTMESESIQKNKDFNEEQISELSVTFNDSTTVTDSISQLQKEFEMNDIRLPQQEPTKPEMCAPRPMMNYSPNKRRHSHSHSCHIRSLNQSRTDLCIDASGDDTTTVSENECNDALESTERSDTVEIFDTSDEDNVFNNKNNSSQGSSPSPIKNIENRSSDIKQELLQRKTAMDNHYIIPYAFKTYLNWYFAIFIPILVIAMVVIGNATFDKTPKFTNTPKFEKHSFLRQECMNNSNISASYLIDYGYDFVSTKYYASNDGRHWIVLSIICIGFMFVIYPLLLCVNAIVLIYRNEYYNSHSSDPLFMCVMCPKYLKYSSPNAPHLSSVLDPNNVQLFNPTLRIPRFVPKGNDGCDGLVTVDEEEFFEESKVSVSDSVHRIIMEPNMPPLPQSPQSEEENKDCYLEEREEEQIEIDGDLEIMHERTVSEVLKDTLLPLNLTGYFSPKSVDEDSSETTMICEDSKGNEFHFAVQDL